MKKFWKFGLSAGLAAVLLAGCGGEDAANEEQEVEAPAETTEETTEEAAEAGFPVTLVDATGEEVVIEEEPQAIISMIPSNTEIIFELGLGDKIVGVTDFDNYPEETADIEKIGGMEFNVEKIISLQPDIVFAHESGLSMGTEGLDQLTEAGLTVFVVEDATNFDEVYDTITIMGQATGTIEEAEAIIQEMEEEVAGITEKAGEVEEAKSVFVEVGSEPEIYTTGSGTFMDEMLQLINAENVAGDQEGWVVMDPEAIVAANPDVIVTTEGQYIENPEELIKSRSGFAEVTAVQEDAVFGVDTDEVSRPGPRLTQGLRELAQAVYPEVFSE